PFAPTGGSRPNSVRRRRRRRKEGSKARWDISGAITGYRCHKRRDLEELNRQLLAGCEADQQRTISGREQNIGTAMQAEQEHLLPLPAEGFDLAEVSFPAVDGSGCVRVRTNFYSTPVPAGRKVQATVKPCTVEIWYEGQCVARHERCYRRKQQILNLEHYLE